jgi:DGQHR domain-containing protein
MKSYEDKNISDSYNEDNISFEVKCIKSKQPIGEFYVGTIDHKRLTDITWFDVRRIVREREVETYLGVQRPLNPARVDEIGQYVTTVDACFPTAVILSVPGACAVYDEERAVMTLSNFLEPEPDTEKIRYREIAKVLDGQHRIAGLKDYTGEAFDVNVSIFVDIDIAEQAYIFSTVNLAQTKVNKSLAYDLHDLAKARSPQKLCHNIAVALDAHEDSPFYRRIKRLGVATEGRFNETITQATFVESLLRYMSSNVIKDRDIYMRGGTPGRATADESRQFIFRNLMIDEKDLEIIDIIWNYFDAVRTTWPTAWDSTGRGNILNKTNGFKALMRFLRYAYLWVCSPGHVPTKNQFLEIFARVTLKDADFNVDNFKPGSSGESELFARFIKECRV